MDVATVTLNLGMPRDKVLQMVKQAGYKVLEMAPVGNETRVVVTQADIDKDIVQRMVALTFNDGELFFRNGSLVGVLREVASSNINTDRDLALSLYAIVKGLEKEGSNSFCSARTTAQTPIMDDPGVEVKELALDCDAGKGVYRTIHIRWATLDSTKDQVHVRVFLELWRLQFPVAH
jgi:hypothetical protein